MKSFVLKSHYSKAIIGLLVTFLLVGCMGVGSNSEQKNETNPEKQSEEQNDDQKEAKTTYGQVKKEHKEDAQIDETKLFTSMTFEVMEQDTPIGMFTIDLKNPQSTYEVEDDRVQITLESYFPDYYMEDGEPVSESSYPLNPAFVMTVANDEQEEVFFIAIGQNVTPIENPIFEVSIADFAME